MLVTVSCFPINVLTINHWYTVVNEWKWGDDEERWVGVRDK